MYTYTIMLGEAGEGGTIKEVFDNEEFALARLSQVAFNLGLFKADCGFPTTYPIYECRDGVDKLYLVKSKLFTQDRINSQWRDVESYLKTGNYSEAGIGIGAIINEVCWEADLTSADVEELTNSLDGELYYD